MKVRFKVALIVTIPAGDKCTGCPFLRFDPEGMAFSCMWNEEVSGGWGDELLRPESCRELDVEVSDAE